MFFFSLTDTSANNDEAKKGMAAADDQKEKLEETGENGEEMENRGELEPTPPPYTLETASEDMELFLSNFASIVKEKEKEEAEAEEKEDVKEKEAEEMKVTEVEAKEENKEAEMKEGEQDKEADKKEDEPDKEAEMKQDEPDKETERKKDEPDKEADMKQDEPDKEAEKKKDEHAKEADMKQDEQDKEAERKEDEPDKEAEMKQNEPDKEAEKKEDKVEEEAEKENEAEVEDEGLEIPDFVEKYLDVFEEKLSILESSAPSDTRVKGYLLPDDDPLFFKAVGQMRELYKDLSAHIKPESKQGPLINRISSIRHRAMCYLEEEFRFILEEFRNKETEQTPEVVQEAEEEAPKEDADQSNEPGEDQPAAEEPKFEEYSEKVLGNISKITLELITGGHELECCEIYMVTRRHVLGETLKNLGYEKISIEEAQKKPWESLEGDIPPWIRTFKQCVSVHLPAERKLLQIIFSSYPSLSDSIITNLARCLFLQFLSFPEAVPFCKLTTEKLFKFLDMYEALRDSLSPIDSVFPGNCAKELRAEITSCRCRIGEATICIFCDLENSIKSDTGKTAVAGGAVHPLTRYIMNYLKYACGYKDTIEQVFKDHSKIERADSTSRPRNCISRSEKYRKNDNGEDRPPFQEQLMRIVDLLEQAIDAKSTLYKDVSLSSIFMMNNGRYMLQKIKGTPELYEVVGDNWCRNRSFDVRNYHKSYQRETWTKLLGCLSNQDPTVRGKVVKPVLKDKFKSFNHMFEEIHRTQSTWVVYDKQLQSELRVSIASVVIPAYRSFLGRYSGYLDPGRQAEKYIKYQPEDIETYIDELFEGKKN